MTEASDRFEPWEDRPVPCRFDGHVYASAIYYTPGGCICYEDKVQALCMQHALKAEQNGVEIYKIADLPLGKEDWK